MRRRVLRIYQHATYSQRTATALFSRTQHLRGMDETRKATEPDPDEVLTVAEAAEEAGISHQAMHAAIRRGSIPVTPTRREQEVRGIRRADLVAYRQRQAADAAAPAA